MTEKRYGGGVSCYIRKDLTYNIKFTFQLRLKKFFMFCYLLNSRGDGGENLKFEIFLGNISRINQSYWEKSETASI